jgi:hypothetical protein
VFKRSQKGVRRWLEAEGLPRAKDLQPLAQFLNVRQEWLMFGLGPKKDTVTDDGQFNKVLMQRIMVSIGQALERAKIETSERQKAQLITALYEALRH